MQMTRLTTEKYVWELEEGDTLLLGHEEFQVRWTTRRTWILMEVVVWGDEDVEHRLEMAVDETVEVL